MTRTVGEGRGPRALRPGGAWRRAVGRSALLGLLAASAAASASPLDGRPAADLPDPSDPSDPPGPGGDPPAADPTVPAGVWGPRGDAAPPDPLEAARDAALSSPDDYAAQVAWAVAAQAAGRYADALAAWTRAATLSGGGQEAALGRLRALVELGRWSEARPASALAVATWPDDAGAWILRARALAADPLASVAATAAARRAVALAPADPDAACALGWDRWRRGDGVAARAAWTAHPGPCATAGLAATAARWTLWGSVGGGVNAWSGGAVTPGGLAVAQAGAASRGGFVFDVTGRFVDLGVVDAARWQQPEVWARVGFSRRGWGGDLAGAALFPSGSAATPVVGGRLWAPAGPIAVTVDGAWAGYADGDAGQIGLTATAPVHRWLRIGGDVRWTTLVGAADADRGWAGGALARVGDGRVWADVAARFGRQLRPVRLDAPTVWNLTGPLGPTLDLGLGGRVHDQVTVWASGTVAWRRDDAGPAGIASTTTVGLTVSGAPRPPTTPGETP